MASCCNCAHEVDASVRFCPQCGARQVRGEAAAANQFLAEQLLGAAVLGTGLGCLATLLYMAYAAVMEEWFGLFCIAPLVLWNQLGLLFLLRARRFERRHHAARKQRSFLRFGLRSFLLAVTVFALVCAWFAAQGRRRSAEIQALADIKQLTNQYLEGNAGAFTGPAKSNITYACPNTPKWLERFCDRLHFDGLYRVESITVDFPFADDSFVAPLLEFKSVKNIALVDTNVSEAGAAELRKAFPNARIVVAKKPLMVDPLFADADFDPFAQPAPARAFSKPAADDPFGGPEPPKVAPEDGDPADIPSNRNGGGFF